MKKTVIIVVGLLLCVVGVTVIGQKKNLSPKEERREVREKRRADRIASFEKTMDSVILSRNFQFNPQTMQRQPAGPMRQIMNPAFNVGVWDGTVDICLPYIKGYVPPYYVMILNYTVPNVIYDRADPRRLDGDLLDFALLGFDLHLHLRDLHPYGRRQPDDHQSVVQPRGVLRKHFSALLV